MKKITNLFAIVLVLVAVIWLGSAKAEAATVADGTCGENLTWTLDDQGTLTISGTGAMTDWYDTSEIPWYYNRSSIKQVVIENGVTTIGHMAFYQCSYMGSVTIADSVTTIGASVFYNCGYLLNITIPDSVTSVGVNAFYDCAWYNNQPAGLVYAGKVAYKVKGTCPATVIIQDGTLAIAEKAFYGCTALQSVTIPDSVTTIGNNAFYDCENLQSVKMGSGVTTVGEGAFLLCTGLQSVTFSDSITAIGVYAFHETAWYNNQPDGLIYIGKAAYTYKGTCPASVTIKDGTVAIAEYAFSECSGLQSITIPDSVTTIGQQAFYFCGDLQSIVIPESVSTIGEAAFGECRGLQSITIPGSITTIERNMFFNCTGLQSVTIQDGVTTIGENAFWICTGLQSVTIPDSVTTIESNAFADCSSLTSVTIPDSVTTIGGGVFYRCTNLTGIHVEADNPNYSSDSCGVLFNKDKTLLIQAPGAISGAYTIPDSVTTIGENAFKNCTALTAVTIGNNVTTIGIEAFFGCKGLTQINFNAINMDDLSIYNNVFTYAGQDGTGIKVTIGAQVTRIPTYLFDPGSYSAYSPKLVSVEFEEDGVCASIGDYAFSYNTALQSVTIPDSVTTIGRYAFKNCTGLLSATTGNGTTIDFYAFSGCTGLQSVTIGNGATISFYAFSGCTGLQSVTFLGSAPTIGEDAFNDCTGLTGVYINDLKAWCEVQFANHRANPIYYAKKLYLNNQLLTDLVIPDGITTIHAYAFRNCTDLTSVTIPDGVTTIGHSALYGCTSLTSVKIPDSVTTISDYAMSECTALTSVDLLENLITIGNGAFKNCTGLQSITIPDSVTTLDQNAFYNCTSLQSITIPDGVSLLRPYVFYNCTSLTSMTIPDGVKSIDTYAMAGCTGLKTVDIIGNLTFINDWSFYGCTNLTSITIPSSVTTINWHAFEKTGLQSVTYCGTAEQWKAINIKGNNDPLKNATLYYHNYANGSCTFCGEADPNAALFDIDVARMILGNALEFQFGVAKLNFEDLSGVYAVVEKGDVKKTIPASQWGTVGQYYAIVYDGLAAKEMADEISVTIYNADGQAISNAKTDSVRAYVARAFASQTAKGKTMMVDMLNYGAAAQQKFNYNTGDLANNQLTAAQKACGTSTAAATSNKLVQGTNYKGTRLVLESRIQMQVAFTGMNRSMYAVYSYTDHNGKTQKVTVNGADFIEVGGLYGIELSQLVYADARQLVTIQIYNSKGKLLSTVKDSMESYVNRSGATDPLFAALMKFTDSAKAYLDA